jgi:VWFA-related protein
MKRGRALLLGVLAATPLGAQEPPEFPAAVEAVHLDVFVSRDGEPLTGLRSEDFAVYDAGARRQAEIVRRNEAPPLHVVLVLDTSRSVAGARLDDLKAAAADFLGGLGQGDRATLTSFAYRTRLESPIGVDPRSIEMGSLRGGGGTALFDAVYAGLLLADDSPGRRPIVVLFSDGEDGLSWLSSERIERTARESAAVIFAIHSSRVEVPSDGTPADLARQRDPTARFLRRLAEDSGGRLWRADEGELRAAFGRVLSELQSHYLLRFSPAPGECAEWHEIEVELQRRKGTVRTRRGYSALCAEP